jgi:hypothetical protein
MGQRRRGRSRQAELFLRSTRPTIPIDEHHRLVVLTDALDWTELEELVERIRRRKVKNDAGRPPHLRTTIGAVVLMGTQKVTLRQAEDLIRHYAPARYLCGLTETDWSPDFTTIHDFTQLMGEDGLGEINEYVVQVAVREGVADPTVMVADTTAQEAAIPYPNEMGLMAAFLTSVGAASKKAGRALNAFITHTAAAFTKAKGKIRAYRLFAKTKPTKDTLTAQMATAIERIQARLGQALDVAPASQERLTKHAKVAHAKVGQLHETMKTLLPQIRHWLRTGHVAADKVLNLHMPDLYAIVRGKVGKTVEFGLRWGIRRLRGGFLLATLARDRHELHDSTFAVRAVDDHIAVFGTAPRAYAYDRGGWSADNVKALREKGVKQVGLAPRGRTPWAVRGTVKAQLVKERALVEAGIGTIKSARYGFNRPAARSVAMMGACGQRAVLGFNLNKLVRELAKRNDVAVVG